MPNLERHAYRFVLIARMVYASDPTDVNVILDTLAPLVI